MSGNITLTDTLSINNKKLSIDLNGHTITAAINQRAFNISNGGTLEIKDSVGNGIIQGNGTVTGSGGAIYMEGSGSALTISGGTIQGFTASTSGGGVYMSDGTFNMTGGAIENCTAPEGAGVKMYPDSGNTCTFTMSDSAEIKNCSNDGVSIAWSGTSKFIMNGGTIDNNKGYGLWTSARSNTEILLNGGTITNSERYDMVIHTGVQLRVNDATVSGKIQNRGTITGTGSAEFTGTVVNESAGKIESGKFKRIEDASAAGVRNVVEYEAYVKLIGHRWPNEETLKQLQNKVQGNVQLKFLSQVTPDDMENTLTIPEDVTVTVDLTGKQVAGENAEKKIINHGNLTLIDSGTGSTLNIPIENNGTLNANGGTVTGEVTNKGTITTTGEKATQFSGGVTNESDGKIENGTFSGEVTNNGAINDGTFSGKVKNNGTIGNGNFTGAVTNEQTGVISGGKFDENKLTNNGGTLPPKPGDNKPGDNKPDDTNKDNDKKEDTYDLTVKNAEVTVKDADGKAVEFTKAEDGTLTAKVPENAEVTVKYTAPTDAIVFDLWSINSDAKLDVNVKENPLTFKMPAQAVTIEAMTQDATIESEGPGVLGTAAMIGVAGAGTAVLGYTGYMIGTELYLNTVLPAGAAIPQNTTELAKLLWTEAGKPAPAAVMAEDATDEQKALTWAVESQLISADKPADASVGRWEVIRGWNRVKEMK
ncbi:right-handed parallel beta-helix repeat-containing protein [Faecalibacterium sp. 4P15]|uniref:right-handed parallel beta-helix repeat-containing protein n=1 Tax=Faecalibacterium duncaniae (strain DSM 17677 / JCM 31915 / A2-165) TaxID=411483 RepID=UPI00164B163A|nr:right-handed parallel beta-helix repeat-containing protein [Faecalibacterium duncaniae]MBC5719108.1 right-handed parallel beta-helix repeat-containing protein [Faecalibacterium duncaniae]